MHFPYILLLTFITAAAHENTFIAGDVSAFPECAKPCLNNAIALAGCLTSDSACFCGSDAQNYILNSAVLCMSGSCSASDIDTTQNLLTETCSIATGASVGLNSGSSSIASASDSSSARTTITGSGATPTTSGGSAPATTDSSSRLTSSTFAAPTATPPASDPKSAPVGAIVGGVVGGLAVLALFVLAVIFLIVRPRRRRRQDDIVSSPYQSPDDGFGKAELDSQQQPAKHELDSQPVHEADSQQALVSGQVPQQPKDGSAIYEAP